MNKAVKDIASILYDDLEFRAMSLPRLGAAVLTLTVVAAFFVWACTDRMFPGFTELTGLTGGIWGVYVFKRRQNPPEDNEDDGGAA